MKKYKFKAFSLIELSVVLLIIGLLILGISKGTRLVEESKLESAQELTISSPVNSISDLRIWIEPTLAKSFNSNEEQDGSTITNWNNINPEATSLDPTSFSQNSGAAKPTYVLNGINNLPTVRFNGSNYLATSLAQTLVSEQLTVFMVCRRKAVVVGTSTAVFYSSAANSDQGNQESFVFGDESFGSVLNTFRNSPYVQQTHPGDSNSYILDTVFNGSTLVSYLNGSASTPLSTSGNFGIDRIVVGSRYNAGAISNQYNGDISEMIVFDRALTNNERKSVEQYLSQKYEIKVSS